MLCLRHMMKLILMRSNSTKNFLKFHIRKIWRVIDITTHLLLLCYIWYYTSGTAVFILISVDSVLLLNFSIINKCNNCIMSKQHCYIFLDCYEANFQIHQILCTLILKYHKYYQLYFLGIDMCGTLLYQLFV